MDRAVWRLTFFVWMAVLALYVRPLLFPVLAQDDFGILAQSLTWERTVANLWVPLNEHAMPLGRLLTFALLQLAQSPLSLPRLFGLVGPVTLLGSMSLVYLLVRRECDHPLYGLSAETLFGVTTVYQQTVFWYAGNFALFGLVTTLLALLCAQRWRQTGRAIYMVWTVIGCALAPGWFAGGILAGPLCGLYLAIPRQKAEGRRQNSNWSSILPSAFCLLPWAIFSPLLGTAFFLAVSLPRTASTILNLSHYGGQRAHEAFDPLTGLIMTGRSVIDNLLLGVVGLTGFEVPPLLVVLLLASLFVAGVWWWRQARERPLLLLGLGLIVGSYWLVYSARAAWGYEGVMTTSSYGRYHLFPQLGLALFFTGGLSGRAGRWFQLDQTGALTPRQIRALAWLLGISLVLQLPRGLGVYFHFPEQPGIFQQLADMEERCRREHISGDSARAVLPKLDLRGSVCDMNGWELLRGSTDPWPLTTDEVKRRLGR
jgi:hypothetical protein